MTFKPFKIRLRSILLIFTAILISKLAHYEWFLCDKYDGNFILNFEYNGPLEDTTCVDFSIKVNGLVLFHTDSIGSCTNKYSINPILSLPTGVNCIVFRPHK